jgi:hypothetical protein
LSSESNKGQGSLGHDGTCYPKRGGDDHLGADVGQQVPKEHTAISGAEGLCRQHELGPAENQHLTSHQARHARPADDSDYHKHDRQ